MQQSDRQRSSDRTREDERSGSKQQVYGTASRRMNQEAVRHYSSFAAAKAAVHTKRYACREVGSRWFGCEREEGFAGCRLNILLYACPTSGLLDAAIVLSIIGKTNISARMSPTGVGTRDYL